MSNLAEQQEWEILTILQKIDLVSKEGCEPGFIKPVDVQDLQIACGLTEAK
jgi:hypothetical protein